MNRQSILGTMLVAALAAAPTSATADATPDAKTIVQKVLDADPWGLGGARVKAHITLTDKQGAKSDLQFDATSRRYDAPFAKTIVRFSAPADLAGAGFLQIQKRSDDDERYLFLPEIKRTRRISGSLRKSAFMGTDFAFADLDRRELREGNPTLEGQETIGKYAVYHLDIVSTRSDSPYSHSEVWVRTDNYLPLKMAMYDHANALVKTYQTKEVERVQGHWYVNRSVMTNVQESHATELVLDQVVPADDAPDDAFTVRALEKI
jgi:hypothetical protein